jgi:transposase-like protein
MPQLQLPFFPHGATNINERLGFMREDDQVTYIYGHLPVFMHSTEDLQTFRMITSQFYINGSATQSELCRAFGVSAISIKRAVKLYRKKGPAGFYEQRRYRGAAVLTDTVLAEAESLLSKEWNVAETAKQLGLKKDTLRKALKAGRLHTVKKTPHKPAHPSQLPRANVAS